MKLNIGSIIGITLGALSLIGVIGGAAMTVGVYRMRIEIMEQKIGTLQDRVGDLDGFADAVRQDLAPRTRLVRTKGRDSQ